MERLLVFGCFLRSLERLLRCLTVGFLFLEDAVGNLADQRFRKLVAEFNIIRHSVLCDVLAAVVEQLLFRLVVCLEAGAQNDERLDLLDLVRVLDADDARELDANFEGEICISGPSVMLRYVDNPEETEHTLRRHDDGRVWLHTGDLGKMDEDGFVYFSQRIKRMIITSGYNVYPGQLENVIDGHEKVLLSCVIGVKDPYKIQKVKAFVVLRPGYEPSDEVKQEILEYCKGHIAKYAMPYDIEFRAELPKTLVGKVAYRVLEEEEAERQSHETN